ncbi:MULTISPECIES: GatB/YqeY domain-containing protein [unclassified Sporosarcina]|uniref:GatB/YqeY domain-containing protein n=1 Tax=unclassified Sporosarcina TaxID=2647733 RepID=UPI000C171AE3|nr:MULTISPECIES: GatB/YqeY domain-containing protein [unclassified Sporosarcina]PIC86942.1 glutamyl-tRNA amidotransferase [Sporosarcina sp. P20a]PIC98983.1 glutamyl-tRNA amidotransferase [Sporosarcina sp. P29]PID05672.1 glutamyl-tRNA amidotransferase [Sporosarcina sp. P30]PID08866.1 glutamyl-tRNA amidotransferase [Sporosarcina sp. P31]PID11857.1 glutamyl-tRNA amidotransferase [Sporosarcina sp. P32b]
MSELKDRLMADIRTAMKEKDTMKKGVINLLRAGLQNESIELKRELTKEEEIKIVQRELKQTKQSLDEGQKANREDIVEAEKAKIAIVESYLPKQMNVEEVKELIASLGISKDASMGQTIGVVMKEVAGRAEGKTVSQAVKEYLQN